MKAGLPTKLQVIIEDFQSLETREEKYEELIQYGSELEEFPESLMTGQNFVAGCTSDIYLSVCIDEGKVHFKGYAESLLVKGLIAILFRGFNETEVDDFLAVRPDFIKTLGITESLTASRANTALTVFNTMQTRIRQLAQKEKAACEAE